MRILIGLLLMLMVATGVAQQQVHTLTLNDVSVDASTGPYFFSESSTPYVRLAAFADSIGANLLSGTSTSMATVWRGSASVRLRISEAPLATEISASRVAVRVGEDLYASLPALAEAFGGTVEWDAANQVIRVDLPEARRLFR